MKRRLQVLTLCAIALLGIRMMAQEPGGGGGGGGGMSGGDASGAAGASGDTGGASSTSGGSGGSATNGGTSSGGSTSPNGSTGDQNGNGTGTSTPSGIDIFGPSSTTVVPGPVAPETTGSAAPIPAFPTPTPAATNPLSGGTQGPLQQAPTTFTLPGGYGGSGPQTFTLGAGRLAKPPITFSATVTQGYDDNIFSAPDHTVPGPTPFPAPTPGLQERRVGFRLTGPNGEILPSPIPIFETFRPKVSSTSAPATATLGVVGSPVSTASVGIQIQKGSPRTVLTLDASVGLQDYWNQPGQQVDATASFDTSFVHRLTPRATISMGASVVYQRSPNFALINAPTTNTGAGGDYVNGSGHIDFTYAWTKRLSTVTSYNLSTNLLQSSGAGDVYDSTYGNQFRFTVSPRNTITSDLREDVTTYPKTPGANSSGTYLLMGLDSMLSARLRNTISGGIESYQPTGGNSQILPYVESATTFALPRGSSLSWTNRYGSEPSGAASVSTTSYRTTLGYSEPLSTKLVATVSLAYNYVENTDSTNAAGTTNQKQLQASLSLGYTVTPRFSLSLSYTYLDLVNTQVNASYQRDQIFLGGTYTFQ